MIIDGKAIAASIRQGVAETITESGVPPRLGIVACAPNFETRTYLDLKERIAASLGVTVTRVVLGEEADTDAVIAAVSACAEETDGVIVQLPLPPHIDRAVVLAAIPQGKDVDAFAYAGEETEILPPVIGAIREIARETGVVWSGARVVIFGSGKLVGEPAVHYAQREGATVSVVDKDTAPVTAEALAREADIIILGVGKPHLLRPEMVREGVVVFDAGASEDGGVIVGDADPAVAHKASVFTPVPGGIGPITIALIFRNLLKLQSRQ